MPKKGKVAEPGLVLIAPGIGDIKIPPVSVCHHVSTIGHLFFPIILLYQFHSGSFIGSPTVPNNLSEFNFFDLTQLSPLSLKLAKQLERYKIGSLDVYPQHPKIFHNQDNLAHLQT